jgi:hypothetical protein
MLIENGKLKNDVNSRISFMQQIVQKKELMNIGHINFHNPSAGAMNVFSLLKCTEMTIFCIGIIFQ